MSTLLQKYQYNILNKPIRTFAMQSCKSKRGVFFKLKQLTCVFIHSIHDDTWGCYFSTISREKRLGT